EPRNQSLMTVVNFPMGAMAELLSAVVFSGICDRHPGVRFVLEEAGVGWVPFLFWRFDREYDWGGASTRVFQPDILLSDKPTEFVKRHVFFTFEVEEEGGFRRVPEVGVQNFLWASDFPGLDSPWPHSKAMGHTPVEAALGKEMIHQLVFENAANLYKIPVTLPHAQART
ncbi:MAG: amidohydrolase family protein, partial [Candidatus Entotheonellia bacterium]